MVNFVGAGCGAADIERFLQLGQEGKRPEQLRLLRQHRAVLCLRRLTNIPFPAFKRRSVPPARLLFVYLQPA